MKAISRFHLITAALAFVAIFTVIFATMSRNINLYDEGIILTGALRVSAGDYPHRDFYANYGPASFYIFAGLFKAFGPKIVIERILDVSIKSFIVLIIFFITRNSAGRPAALLSSGISLIYLAGIGSHAYPIFPTLLFSLLSLQLLVTSQEADGASPSHFFVSGLLIGISALFRYDIGFFVYLAMSVAILLWHMTCHNPGPRRTIQWLQLLAMSLGASLPVLAIILAHVVNNSLSDFFFDVIKFPAEHYAATRSLPFPPIRTLKGLANAEVYLPILVSMVFLWKYLTPRLPFVSDEYHPKNSFFLIATAVLTVFFYIKGMVRVSTIHMLLSIITATMLSTALVFNSRQKLVRTIAMITVVIFFIASGKALLNKSRQDELIAGVPGSITMLMSDFHAESQRSIITNNGNAETIFTIDRSRSLAIQYLASRTSPGDYFYSGTGRHDKIFVNDNASYFLLSLLPATKWHHFDPELQNEKSIQNAMISDIQVTHPQYLWLDSSWDNVKEPNRSADSSHVTILDNYIKEHYTPVQKFGNIAIFERGSSQRETASFRNVTSSR